MRRLWMAGVGLLLCACGEPAQPRDAEDLLVLELGGDSEPLGRALLRLRGGPPPQLPANDAADPVADPVSQPVVEPPEEVLVETPPPDPVRTSPPPQPEFFSVKLRQGETLYGLARTHLGSGARWRELLALNGWSEGQAGQLPVGTMVKVPIRRP